MKPIILCIETATKMCSLALYEGDRLLAIKEQGGAYSHAENITVFINEVLTQSAISISQIDAIAVSKGPGSYTGLRIGVSTAKGLALAINKPIVAVNILESMAAMAAKENIQTEYYCPMIDARRMEVYCAIYNSIGEEISAISAKIIDENSFSEFLSDKRMLFFGDGADKCKSLLSNKKNALFADKEYISASGLIDIALKKIAQNKFEDIAYLEPFYLKDFVTIPSSK
jgi:tRNA threonylcarbamoyladenosine biosynthesis protein TsaB